MQVEVGRLVTLTYEFSTQEGQILGTSEKNGPFSFVVGSGDALESLEKQILGAQEGEELSFVLEASEAYGDYDNKLVRTLPLASLKLKEPVHVGQQLYDEQGKILCPHLTYWVREVGARTLTVDANHPMAGLDLFFRVTVLYVGEIVQKADDQPSACACGKDKRLKTRLCPCS